MARVIRNTCHLATRRALLGVGHSFSNGLPRLHRAQLPGQPFQVYLRRNLFPNHQEVLPELGPLALPGDAQAAAARALELPADALVDADSDNSTFIPPS